VELWVFEDRWSPSASNAKLAREVGWPVKWFWPLHHPQAKNRPPEALQTTDPHPYSAHPSRSEHIDKVGPLVAQSLNLILRLSLDPPIPPSSQPLLILPHQQKPLEQTPPQEKQRQIR